jgi:hypothetical protein
MRAPSRGSPWVVTHRSPSRGSRRTARSCGVAGPSVERSARASPVRIDVKPWLVPNQDRQRRITATSSLATRVGARTPTTGAACRRFVWSAFPRSHHQRTARRDAGRIGARQAEAPRWSPSGNRAGPSCVTAQSGHRFVATFKGIDKAFERRRADSNAPSPLEDLVGPLGRGCKHEAGKGFSVGLSCGAQPSLLVWLDP